MNILKRIKKNKEKEKKEDVSQEIPAYEEKKAEKKKVSKDKTKGRVKVVTVSGKSVLKKPWVSEKTTDLNQENKHVFLVEGSANKSEVKKEISRRYNVLVKSVNTIRMKGKRKRLGNRLGRRPGFKKVIVTLKEGQKIEII